jgi:cell division inhibitor SepF
MPGVWKRTMQYLGLVEEEDLEEVDVEAESSVRHEAAPVRRYARSEAAAIEARPEGVVRTMPNARPTAMQTIHRAEPKRFNEAREIGDRYKQAIPVIVNLQGTEDAIARRLVDFASGLVFGLGGKIELVAHRVYLLTPADMEVSAEEREKIVEGGFFNQF